MTSCQGMDVTYEVSFSAKEMLQKELEPQWRRSRSLTIVHINPTYLVRSPTGVPRALPDHLGDIMWGQRGMGSWLCWKESGIHDTDLKTQFVSIFFVKRRFGVKYSNHSFGMWFVTVTNYTKHWRKLTRYCNSIVLMMPWKGKLKSTNSILLRQTGIMVAIKFPSVNIFYM